MSIKYYQLAKDEELPDEFCAVRDVDGEPSEYTFYVPETENAKLREEFNKMDVWHSKELTAAMDENSKLRELCASLYEFAMGEYPDGTELNFADRMKELGIEVGE